MRTIVTKSHVHCCAALVALLFVLPAPAQHAWRPHVRASQGPAVQRDRATAWTPPVVASELPIAPTDPPAANARGRIIGDYDGDLDVDQRDLAEFAGCMSGPDVAVPSQRCRDAFDSEADLDVDLADFAAVQAACTGVLYTHPPFVPAPGQSDGERTGTIGNVWYGIYPHSGEFTEDRRLLFLWGRGGLHWDLTVTYRSGIVYDGALGRGWDFNQDIWLQELPESGSVLLHHGNGCEDVYLFIGPGQPYQSPPGAYDRLEKEPGGRFMLTDRNGTVTLFNQWGLAESVTHRTGNAILYEYCPIYLRLLRLTDALGRQVLFNWDPEQDRLASVVDPEGRVVTFGYNPDGQLVTITLPPTPDQPAGSTTTFTYSSGYGDPALNDNLLSIQDAKGQVFLENVYDPQDRVISQRYGPPGSITQLLYSRGVTVVTDQDGYVVDYEYDGRGLMYRTTLHTHGVRPGDPPTFVYQQEHNAYAQLTRLTLPRGNQLEYAYDETNPDPLGRGNLLAVRNVSHLPGEPVLTTSYTYEPRFNLTKTGTDTRGQTITGYFDYEEATLGDLNGDGITTQAAGNVVRVDEPLVTLGQPAPQSIIHRFWYDEFGNTTRQIEPDGEVIVYGFWDSGPGAGMLRSVTHDFGGLNLTTEYGYNARGDDLWQTDPGGNTTQTDVNALGQVLRTVRPAPFLYETVYHYDANGNCVSEAVQNVDENGVVDPNMPWIVTTYEYDILNHMTACIEQVGPGQFVRTDYLHNVDGLCTWMRDPMLNEQTWVYDERDLLYQHTRGYGTREPATVTFNYDGNRNLTQRISAEGFLNEYVYDGYDRLISHLDPEGNQVVTQYEGLNLVHSVAHFNAGGDVLRNRIFLYDEAGRMWREDQQHLDSSLVPVGDGWATTTWQRDPCGRPLVKTFDDLSQMRAEYDGAGRETAVIRPGSPEDRTDYQLNTLGSVVLETRTYTWYWGDPVVVQTSYQYDTLQRLVRQESAGGSFTEHRYNSRSLQTVESNALGTLIRRVYDGLGRETEARCEAPVFRVLRAVEWDAGGRPACQLDGNGNATTTEFDAFDRPVRVTYADLSERTFAYDRDDRLMSRTNPTGTVETIAPDFAGRPLEVDIAPGPGVGGPTHISYSYDGLGRIVWGQTSDLGGPLTTNEWHFDTLANLDCEVQWAAGAMAAVEIASSFDGCGNQIGLTYPNGPAVERSYDDAHRLTWLTYGGDTIAMQDYLGRSVARRQYAEGTVLNTTFDNQLRPMAMTHTRFGDLLAGFEYAHDTGDRKQYERRQPGMIGDAYHYNEMGEFLGAKYGVPDLAPPRPYESYMVYSGYSELELDHQQNRMTRNENGLLTTYNAPGGTWQPDPLNRYYWINGVSRTHDGNGNLTYDGSRTFVYDSRNLLIAVQPADEQYLRDCTGRVARVTLPDGTKQFRYYDREHCITEQDGYGVTLAQYVWGHELDDLVLMERGANRYFCHENALGSISLVTDNTGARVEKIAYDAYGRPSFFRWDPGSSMWLPVPQSTIGLPYLFTGQRYDASTGLYDYRTRTYDTETGRYLQPDGEQGLWQQYLNRYSYGDNANDYVNHTSPYGTGGSVLTHSWTSGAETLTEANFEHIEYEPIVYEVTTSQNKVSVHKNVKVKVDKKKQGPRKCMFGDANLTGNNCTNGAGINVRVERNDNTVEIYVDLDFTINIYMDKVCTKYKEKDPEIVKKRNKQGKPREVHVTAGFIEGHERTHVDQITALLDATILEWIQKLDPKSKGFGGQIKEKLKKAYGKFKQNANRNYPSNDIEREARQKALEKWDQQQPKYPPYPPFSPYPLPLEHTPH